MPGKNRPHNRSLPWRLTAILLLAIGLLAGVRPAVAAGGPVAILVTDDDPAYQEQAASFKAEIELPCELFNLRGDVGKDPGLKDRLLAIKPSLIYALGAKAAFAAKIWTQPQEEIPVLFAMVLNWQRYKLLEGSSNVAGIAAEMSPGTQLANMTLFSPGAKRVGMVYSTYSDVVIGQARKEAAILGLELVAEPIPDAKEFQRVFKKIEESVDVFWVLNDPTLYTLENLDWLEERCVKKRLLCVGQTQNLAKAGMTLTINPDFSQLSVQTAAMAKNMIRGQKPDEVKVMTPLATQILVNSRTAERIGLVIPAQALGMATAVIGK